MRHSGETREHTLGHRDLNKYPREVRKALLDITNRQGVKFRRLDATHILLYPVDGTSRPFKVSASRPVVPSMHFIRDFCRTNHLEEP